MQQLAGRSLRCCTILFRLLICLCVRLLVSVSSELLADPYAQTALTPFSSEADVERARKHAYKQYLAERKEAIGNEH
jgi:hypothetical protein